MTEHLEARTRYAPVAINKFIVLYVATLGVYGLVWLYRNWRYVKVRDHSDIRPLARAVFLPPVWYYLLLVDLQEEEGAPVSGWLAFAYFVFLGSWRFPDPYWLVGVASVLVFLPPLTFINRLNRDTDVVMPAFSSWRRRNVFLVGAGSILLSLIVVGAVGPSTRVVSATEIRPREIAFLQEIGLVKSPDEVLYFYSPGFISIRGEGTVLTVDGVGAYWTDSETGERVSVFATADDIVDIIPRWSLSWAEPSLIHIRLLDGSGFTFLLSNEADGDRRFIQELERQRDGGPAEVIPVA